MLKNCELTYYKGYSRQKWLALREKFTGINTSDHFAVGASEVSTIMGHNKYESSLEFYSRAIGLAPKKNINNASVYRGIVQEPYIYKEYWRYFNPDEPNVWDVEEERQRFFDNANIYKKVYRSARQCNAVVVNPKYPHLFINYDYLISKNKLTPTGPLELKSQMGAAMDSWESGINPAYILQVQDQMLVGGFKYGEVFVLRNSEMPVLFPFDANKNIQEQIIDASEEWAKRIISVKQVLHSDASQDEKDAIVFENEPPIQAAESWIEYLKESHKPENKREVECDQDLLQHVIHFLEAKREKKEVEAKILEPEVHIRKFIYDSEATKIILPDELGHISCDKKLSISPKILTTYEQRYGITSN